MKIRNKFQTNEIKNINIESKEIKLIFIAYQYDSLEQSHLVEGEDS